MIDILIIYLYMLTKIDIIRRNEKKWGRDIIKIQYNTITVITNRMFVLLCGAMTLSVCRQV
ncbi:hypothetical protein HMPREF9445_01133 [Bacteroides clarus YIT 12056]|uniref:Uncharacterized protein n=1 Tax=Bacteroides clarus YIT 12056 TaxID=762984 RepID=A0ABP2KT69_9BACE|nr:hypothetical protein HMPREF9445_01133 [Bacteroides clarus YIT 12056]